MAWYHYIASLFAGIFLTNAVPHFVKGVCGDGFPTPFAKPPGKGLSSPLVNVLWALFNLIVGYILLQAGKVWNGNRASLLLFLVGVILISLMGSTHFANKDAS